jgi:hypothetical protein
VADGNWKRLQSSSSYPYQVTSEPVSLDKKGGRKCHLLLGKRWRFLPPLKESLKDFVQNGDFFNTVNAVVLLIFTFLKF